MSKAKVNQKKKAYAEKEERQAKRTLVCIAAGLIGIMLLLVGGYYIAFN